jgi:threonine dehydrogenase-like Zn-dependent dehydrogenase
MRAVCYLGDRSVAVENVPDPVLPGPDGVIVAISATAICGSDLHIYHGGLGAPGTRLGHECIGTVVEAGPAVSGVRVGDRVLVSAVIGCGHCDPCRRGDPVLCAQGATAAFGTTLELPGAQAEFIAVPAADLFVRRIPDGVRDDDAVLLTDVLATGYLGASMADITPGATVAIFGLGPVGLMALACAQLFGPAQIFAVDLVPERLARAAAMGASPIDATGGDAVAQIVDATKGRGVDAAIEAVGHDQTVLDAVGVLASGGTASVIGVNLSSGLPYPMGLAFLKRLTLRAAFASVPMTWPALFPLLQSGALTLPEIFTHRLSLDDAARGYDLFDRRLDGCGKVLFSL